MSVQRFKLKTGAREKQINKQLPTGITAAIMGLDPSPVQDWNLSDDAGLSDLQDALEFLDWEYVGQSPTSPRPVIAPEYQGSVIDQDLTAPPGSPTNGDRYLVAQGGSGAWAGHDGEIAQWRAAPPAQWLFAIPVQGTLLWVQDEKVLLCHDGTQFVNVGPRFSRAVGSQLTTSSAGSDSLINAMRLTAVASPSTNQQILPGNYTVSFWADVNIPSGVTGQFVLYDGSGEMSNTRAFADGPQAVRWPVSIVNARLATVALGETIEARLRTSGGSVTFRDRRISVVKE